MGLFQTNFTPFDWFIVILYISGSAVIGLWANKFVGNLSDYLVAGRTLRIRLALASMTGTELGLVTVMYMSELGFTHQYAALYLGILEAIAFLIIGGTGFVVCKLRQTEVLTIPEYFQKRYSPPVRVLGGTVMVLAGVLNMGLFLKAGSVFVTALTGISDPTWLKWVMTSMLLLVLFYTVLGGMVSVVITDLIQFFVLGISLVIACLFIFMELGFSGLEEIVTLHHGYVDPFSNTKPPEAFHLSLTKDNTGLGPLTIFQMAVVVGAASFLWPTTASRTLSVKSPDVARKLFLFSTIPLLARRAIPVFLGLGAFAWFANHPNLANELTAAIADKENNISGLAAMPLFLAKIIPTGLLGVIAAGMLAAFMSTHDSYLLCWSGVITQDICGPLFGPLSQRSRILITRISIVVIGLMLLFWGLWYELDANLWGYMAITGTVYFAGALPTVVGGLYWNKGSSAGAITAILLGLLGVLALDQPVSQLNALLFPDKPPLISGVHITVAVFIISSIGYVLMSLFYPDKNQNFHPSENEKEKVKP